jgi:hypothetical protein
MLGPGLRSCMHTRHAGTLCSCEHVPDTHQAPDAHLACHGLHAADADLTVTAACLQTLKGCLQVLLAPLHAILLLPVPPWEQHHQVKLPGPGTDRTIRLERLDHLIARASAENAVCKGLRRVPIGCLDIGASTALSSEQPTVHVLAIVSMFY